MRLSECPVRAVIDVVDGKWKPIIINALKAGSLRFGQLRREVPEATKKVLTAQLRDLEQDEIISRKKHQGDEDHLRYELTAYGRTLVPILRHMAEWGANHKKRVANKLSGKGSHPEDL